MDQQRVPGELQFDGPSYDKKINKSLAKPFPSDFRDCFSAESWTRPSPPVQCQIYIPESFVSDQDVMRTTHRQFSLCNASERKRGAMEDVKRATRSYLWT